jgi:general secretion pathway protein B
MSFILEALKKSEQQRQQKNTTPQEVRQRTLSLPAQRSSRSLYYKVAAAGFLPLLLLSGWWLYSEMKPNPEMEIPPRENSTTQAPPALAQPKPPEPAPVPRDSVATPLPLAEDFPPANSTLTAAKNYEPATRPRQVESPTPRERQKPAEPLRGVGNEPREAHPDNRIPLYLDLSRELRDRMPRLTMSMHYHSSDPARRLVRINDRLLHEGDWLSEELQLVEITPTGAIFDFSGKAFAMRSQRLKVED